MSEPLTPRHLPEIGGYRLLARLGSGGMGAVHLGRSAGGSLAAVKVVHPELAQEADFRARFRREVEAARRVDSPWTASVVAAGPDEPAPWLAMTFVPGPSLGEAVRRFGPLPASSVRALGRMLAEALREVHAAGLVHRDVKPGNVLLAVDGPRLIDFGIARSAGQTALTSTGRVAGTPGFLSPEQAEGHTAEVGPASDVFSLGCLLAFAATGRPPFGSGAAEAVLYRIVHDEPDLDGLDAYEDAHGDAHSNTYGDGSQDAHGEDSAAEDARAGSGLPALLRSCMAKDPAERPTVRQIEARLAGRPGEAGSWLPDSVVRDVADRSARALALPGATDAAAEPAVPTVQLGTGGTRGISRRRMLVLGSGGVAAVAGGGGALWAVTREPGSGGPRWALGVQADLSGPGRAAGLAQKQGARLAVERYNARRDKPFELELRTEDDRGSGARSGPAAKRLADDEKVLAVLGPTSELTAERAVATYDEAFLPVLFVVAGGINLRLTPCRSSVHCRTPDMYVAFPLALYIGGNRQFSRPGILEDRTADVYAWEITDIVTSVLRDVGKPAYPRVVPAGQDDLGPQVDDILRSEIDSFVYAGYAEGAAGVARDLAAGGFDGARLGAQALMDPVFLDKAGEAAEGWLLSAPFIDPAEVKSAAAFRTAFRRRFGAEPGYYAAEAYDAANLTIRELVRGAERGRPPSRQKLVALLRGSTYRGVAKSYSFDRENGDFTGKGAFMYRVEDGEFRYAGPAPEVD